MHRTKGQDSTRNSGFTILELMVVVIVLGIISALALPQALIGVKAYRLHSNAAGFAGHLNLARYRATSQYAPYRVRISTSVVPHQFSLERLCGGTSSSVDSNCSSAYQARTNGIEGGSLPLERGNVFTTTNPGGTTSYPGTITGGSASTVFYFNTRGMPVDSSGNPLTNGGAVVYLTNGSGLTDAIVVSVGGRVSIFQWNPSSSTWSAR